MTVFKRGVQLYLVVVAFIATLGLVWGANRLVLENTTAATGWPVMAGLAGVVVVIGVFVHRRRKPSEPEPVLAPYPWSDEGRE